MILQIRRAIQDSGLSINELSRKCGVSQPQISRFMSGERTLTLPAAVKVCETLGLKLVGPDGSALPLATPRARPAQPPESSSPERPKRTRKPKGK